MKRLVDVVLSLFALLVFRPLIAVTAILVRWRLKSPILFRQRRPGIHGKPFYLVKFRTMVDHRDESDNAERLTRFGRFLRATSLDELPELWNVFRGEMSLIGPRPLLMQYLPLHSREQMRRLEVLPGITGWAQVNGRNNLSWENRFVLDVGYVDHRLLWLDAKMVLLTILQVIRRDGITAVGEATMPRFTGSKASDGL